MSDEVFELDIEWKEVNPDMWKPDNEGDQIMGVLVEKELNKGMNNSTLYTINKGSDMVSFWGSTVLDDRMRLVKTGDIIRVTYKGKKKSESGRDVKIYKLEKGEKRLKNE